MIDQGYSFFSSNIVRRCMPGARLVACVAASWTNIELYYKIFDTLFLTHWPSVSPSRGLGFKDSVILSITLSIALLYTQTLVDCAAVWRTRLQRQRYSVNHTVNRSTSHTDTGRLCRRLADSTSVQRDSSGDSC